MTKLTGGSFYFIPGVGIGCYTVPTLILSDQDATGQNLRVLTPKVNMTISNGSSGAIT